jgi:hypothetical protein
MQYEKLSILTLTSRTQMGTDTDASGDYALATGDGTTASGDYSTSFGKDTTASGEYSYSGGYMTKARGAFSTAIGYQADAIHDYSFVWADGWPIETTAQKQFVVYARGGIRLLGGAIEGNGSSITNLDGANVQAGTIDVLSLDSGVQSSLGLADSAVQVEADTNALAVIATHINDTTDAHVASAISATGTYANVQLAVNAIGSGSSLTNNAGTSVTLAQTNATSASTSDVETYTAKAVEQAITLRGGGSGGGGSANSVQVGVGNWITDIGVYSATGEANGAVVPYFFAGVTESASLIAHKYNGTTAGGQDYWQDIDCPTNGAGSLRIVGGIFNGDSHSANLTFVRQGLYIYETNGLIAQLSLQPSASNTLENFTVNFTNTTDHIRLWWWPATSYTNLPAIGTGRITWE